MPKYIIYDNGFNDVHVLKFSTTREGIPVYEHYKHVKQGFSAAQDMVRRLEVEHTDECTCSKCIERYNNRALANKTLARVKKK